MAPRKPPTAAQYTPRDVALVRSACLTLATYLGSFLDDLVVVGGLVPTLLVGSDETREPHVGTQEGFLGRPRDAAFRALMVPSGVTLVDEPAIDATLPFGCVWHPGTQAQAALARALAPRLTEALKQ